VLVVALLGSAQSGAPARAAPSGIGHLTLSADVDDDDGDGVADRQQTLVGSIARVDAAPLPPGFVGATLRVLGARPAVARVIGPDGRVVPWGKPVPRGAVLQGVVPSQFTLVAEKGSMQDALIVDVRGVAAFDGARRAVSAAKDWLSLARTPPAAAPPDPRAGFDDPDEVRFVVEVPEVPGRSLRTPRVSVESLSAAGQRIDEVATLALSEVSCEPETRGVHCFSSPPVRIVVDEVDRSHPLVSGRAVRGEVGGGVVLRDEGRKLATYRVLGPRTTAVGPIQRLLATLRPVVFRVAPGSAPSIGGTEVGAVSALRTELAMAAAVWGQCGVTFGDVRSLEVRIADPPPPWLLALGDDLGLPAAGGEIRFRVDGRAVVVPTRRGTAVDHVAHEVAGVIDAMGFRAQVSPNARIGPAAAGSIDVLVRRKSGAFAQLEAPVGKDVLSTDRHVSARIGAVDLADGLQHFTDIDAVAGTLEERTLLKSVDDGDPHTIELVIVPFFAGGIRIGESFIGSDASSIRNTVLLDRAGVRARRSSFTLAHELGHVLLDMADHPDDYGVDTPTLLMDSDAADASAFGPRRLSLQECARMMQESGPGARVPLLAPLPAPPLRVRARLP
jgi:hypothetical protein